MNEERIGKCLCQVEHIKGVFRTEAVKIFRTEVVIRGKADNIMVISKIIKKTNNGRRNTTQNTED
jgi:hypothetical protein